MEHPVSKKRLNTYKNSEGRLENVSDEVIMEVLRAWENWPGTTADLYRELDLSKMQMVSMIKKGKKLVANGTIVESDFHEVNSPSGEQRQSASCATVIEIAWRENQVIRFGEVDQLVDFLKKVG